MQMKKVLSILLVAVMLISVIPFTAFAATTVTWTSSQLNDLTIYTVHGEDLVDGNSIGDITVTPSGEVVWSDTLELSIEDGSFIFTSSGDDISSIVISADIFKKAENLSSGWSVSVNTLSWSGTPAKSVTLSGEVHIWDISQVVFTLGESASATYTVTWQNEDGTELETDTDVAEGTVPTYDGATPTKATDEKYMYFFSGWSPEVTAVTGDITYTAQFDKQVVGLYLQEGDVLDKDETIRFPIMTRGNEFSGHVLKVYLDGELVKSVEVQGASSIEPDRYYTTTQKCIVSQFSKGSQWPTIRNTIYLTSLHTVTWQNEDGTVLETDTDVEAGTTPTYNGETPTKAATVQYTYAFTGWTPEVSAVTGDVIYTAVYSQSVRQYTVTWKNYDDSVIGTSTVNAGQTPEFSDSIGQIKAKPADENHSYEFTGWTPEIVAAEADAEYTATFVDVLSISNVDEWNSFAASVKGGNTYSGKIVRMTADVGPVTTMVAGTFSGTFDGGSHTLTVNISGGNASVATFEVVKDATIQNLTLAGSITSSGIHSAAIVKSISDSGTSCTIKNVDIYADVNCSNNYLGGFIGHAGTANTVNIENSIFAGSINKTGSGQGGYIGGFIGWSQQLTATINNCAFTGSYSNIKSFNNIGFSYNAPTKITVNDFYSNVSEVFGTSANHGTRLYTPSSSYPTTVALVNHGGEKTFFHQLSDALNAWVDGSTLMLMSDVTTENTISVGGNKTLDLNGYKLRISRNNQVISLQEGGDLTIKSSAQGGEVIGCNADRAVVGGKGQTLTLESGTIKTAASNAISGTNAVFNLNGGAIECTSNSSDMTVASAVYCKGNCTVNWNGTSITTNTGCGFYSKTTTDTVKIGGGSFAATADTLPDNAGYVLSNYNVEIQGAPVLNGKGIYLSNGRVINVTGELTNDVPIGVVMQTPGVFTSGLQGNGGIANFAYGNGDDYGIGLDASGEAQVVRKYTVTWKFDETTVLATDKVLEDTVPTFTGTAPADYSDTYYNYTFTGWTPAPVAATADATYTAAFTATAKTFTVFVKTLTGKTISVQDVTGETTVAQIKDMLVEETGLPAALQKLIFAGTEMENAQTLADCNVQKESTIHLSVNANNGSSLTLDDVIALNAYLDIDAFKLDATKAYVKLNYNQNADISKTKDFEDVIIPVSEATKYIKEGDPFSGTYKFSFRMAPAQYAEDITISLYADGEAQTPVFTTTTSIKTKCEQFIANGGALGALCEAVADYCQAAQFYFDYDAPATASYYNDGVTSLEAGDMEVPTASVGISATGYSFTIVSGLEANVFFSGSLKVKKVSIDSSKGKGLVSAKVTSKQGNACINIKGIASGNLDNLVTVTTNTGSISLAATNIAKAIVASSNNIDFVNLARALYLYSVQASSYFGC